MVEASLALLANIAHHISLIAQTYLDNDEVSKIETTPLAAIIPSYGLVPPVHTDEKEELQKEENENHNFIRLQHVLDTFVSRLMELIQLPWHHFRMHVLYVCVCALSPLSPCE